MSEYAISRARSFDVEHGNLDPYSEESYEGLASQFAEAVVELADERNALRAEVEQYKRAKAENDERFMLERDAARLEVERMRKLVDEPVKVTLDQLVEDKTYETFTPTAADGAVIGEGLAQRLDDLPADQLVRAFVSEAVDLDVLEAKARAAMPGPWNVADESWVDADCVLGIDSPSDPVAHATPTDGPGASLNMKKADAAFVAAANPRTVLTLIAEIRRLRDER